MCIVSSSLLDRKNSSSDGRAKQWIYWDPSYTRKRNDPSSPWFNFTDKYQPIFDFFSDTSDDGKQDFWNSVATCNKDRTYYSKLRLNQKNDEFTVSCLEENLNQASDVSPEISSSKNMVSQSEFISSSVHFFSIERI